MKPFNLEEYLKDPSKKVITRDGREVRIICTNKLDQTYPICALINNGKEEECYSYTVGGKHYALNIDSNKDLFFSTEKREGWINILNVGNFDRIASITIYSSEEDAKKRMIDNEGYIATIKIEWEE